MLDHMVARTTAEAQASARRSSPRGNANTTTHLPKHHISSLGETTRESSKLMRHFRCRDGQFTQLIPAPWRGPNTTRD